MSLSLTLIVPLPTPPLFFGLEAGTGKEGMKVKEN